MARAIDAKLVEFKTKVGGSISSMQTTVSDLSSRLSSLSTLCSNTSDAISNAYKSVNQATVLSKFTQIEEIYKKISNSLESDLGTILSRASVLVENVTKLELLLKEIQDAESRIANAGSYRDESSASNWFEKREIRSHNAKIKKIIDEAQAVIDSKGPEFDSLHTSSLAELTALQGMDSSLNFVSEFSITDITTLSQYYLGGELVEKTYTASNGVKVNYFIYVPQYSTDVTGLPVHVYLHGAGEFGGDETLTTSLPAQIKKGVIKPNGIVICPQGSSAQASNNQWWNDNAYEDALIELTNNVVQTYQADSNRISLSGHSQGAIGGYRLISRNPGYFSAFMPVSGHSKKMENTGTQWQTLGDVKIWAFHGTTDSSVEYAGATNVKSELEKLGYDNMEIYAFKGRGHSIQNDVYKNSYEYSDGTSYNPLDWAFLQDKSKN